MDDDQRARLYTAIESACDDHCHGVLEHVICRIKHRAVHRYAVKLLTLDLPDQYHRDVVETAAALHGFDVDIDQYLDAVIEPREIPLVQTVVHNCGSSDPVLVEGRLVQDAVRLFDSCIYGHWYEQDSPYLRSHDSGEVAPAPVTAVLFDGFWYAAAVSFAKDRLSL